MTDEASIAKQIKPGDTVTAVSGHQYKVRQIVHDEYDHPKGFHVDEWWIEPEGATELSFWIAVCHVRAINGKAVA